MLMMKRSQYIILAVSAACVADYNAEAGNSGKGRPNVIMISVDDWNVVLGGAFGNVQAVTPNLDRLMSNGVTFLNCRTAASFSTPSRTALMTGMAPWKSGCYENQPHLFNIPDRITIDELLQKNGYKTFGAGKVYHHMPGYVNLDGFDEYFLWNPEHKKKGWKYGAWEGTEALVAPIPIGELGKAVYDQFDVYALPDSLEKEMADTKTVDWAVDVIGRKHDAPFYLAVGLYSPHKPNYCPKKYFDMHPLEKTDLTEFQNDTAYFNSGNVPSDIAAYYRGRINRQHLNGIMTVEDGWKKAVQGYLACCSYADAQIGRILDALRKSEYADNTIVIFWSDNGYHLGEKQLWAKHTMYRQTSNVPMIWAGRNIDKNRTYDGIVSLLDIFPTLIDVCGLQDTDDVMDGISIRDILEGGNGNPGRYAVMANKADGFSVITREWHYNFYSKSGSEELFDAENDMYELHNLSENETYSEVLKQMRKLLPESPAEPGASPGSGCRLVCEGETFRWIKK